MLFDHATALTHAATRWDRIRWEHRVSANAGLECAEMDLARALRDANGKAGIDPGKTARDARAFAGEVFSRVISDPDELDQAVPWAKRAQDLASSLEGFDGLRAALAGDPDLGAIATRRILEAVAERLPALLETDEDDEQAARRAEGKFRAGVRRALKAAQEDVAEAREALEGIAPGMGSVPATHEQQDPTRLALADMLLRNPRFSEVLRRAGKLRRIAQSKATRRARGVGTIVGLERGADLGRVLPAQLARLQHPALRALALKDMAERALMQYRVEGREPQGRGPIVIMVDESSSMEGHSELWAKAVVIAAVRQAQAEQRPVSLCYFDHRIRTKIRIFADGSADQPYANVAGVVQDALTRRPAGGTSFNDPLTWGMDELENGADRADLIMVTDGWADASDEVLARLEAQRERGTRVFGLLVGGGRMGGLGPLCDEVVDLDATPEDQIADRLAGAVPVGP